MCDLLLQCEEHAAVLAAESGASGLTAGANLEEAGLKRCWKRRTLLLIFSELIHGHVPIHGLFLFIFRYLSDA